MTTTQARVRVRYAETDQMGIVYHANYIIWMEIGRVEHCRTMGLRYKDMEAEGVLLTVAEVKCRFSYPARYDDEVAIETVIVKAHPRIVIFNYVFKREADGKLLASGETKHVFCGPDLQPRKLPAKYQAAFGITA
jgi:acyl-CoA thioester hydrolase